MGKLHTLRRSIERNPKAFIDRFDSRRACAADRYYRGKGAFTARSPYLSKAYRAYVRKVLRTLGYVVQ